VVRNFEAAHPWLSRLRKLQFSKVPVGVGKLSISQGFGEANTAGISNPL